MTNGRKLTGKGRTRRGKRGGKVKMKVDMEQMANKMQHMIGLGPIAGESVRHFKKAGNESSTARKLAVEEYLHYYLDFSEGELKDLRHSRDKTRKRRTNISLLSRKRNTLKEIHFRMAESANVDLVSRDFIPPQYHSRYMAVRNRAT